MLGKPIKLCVLRQSTFAGTFPRMMKD